MTNEEAIKELKDASDREFKYGDTRYHHDEVMNRIDAFELAIKALEQNELNPSYNGVKSELKSCDDCISRQAIKEMLTKEWTKYMPMELDINLSFVLEKISELPSVTPKQKMGRWILEEVKDEDGRPYDIKYFCSECQAERPPIWDDYCSACGAKMLQAVSEEQESENQ